MWVDKTTKRKEQRLNFSRLSAKKALKKGKKVESNVASNCKHSKMIVVTNIFTAQ